MGTTVIYSSAYLIFVLASYAFAILISLVSHILQAICLYTVAKRRNIGNAWVAWVPSINYWLLGAISDHYRVATQGKDRKLRTKLLWLVLATWILLIPMLLLEIPMTLATTTPAVLLFSVLIMLLALVMMAVSIAGTIFQYMAIYDYFRSCAGDKAVLYLLLSIFIPFAYMVLSLIVRNQDLGMPPEQEEPQPV